MQGPWRPDIVNAGSWETRYSECWVRGACIHYIWSPWTLHSLYLVSMDLAFTISGLPQHTKHGNAIILVNTNC
ncbi:unnamed protein product [Staurois parvus]|uniref:Uncharacterized protein n=1 Tax=Staurois parvus TaxID=386267 RepID=A0ABN9BTL8_9NEOB|nr:unnamed protein product [Staurois parvus]